MMWAAVAMLAVFGAIVLGTLWIVTRAPFEITTERVEEYRRPPLGDRTHDEIAAEKRGDDQ